MEHVDFDLVITTEVHSSGWSKDFEERSVNQLVILNIDILLKPEVILYCYQSVFVFPYNCNVQLLLKTLILIYLLTYTILNYGGFICTGSSRE